MNLLKSIGAGLVLGILAAMCLVVIFAFIAGCGAQDTEIVPAGPKNFIEWNPNVGPLEHQLNTEQFVWATLNSVFGMQIPWGGYEVRWVTTRCDGGGYGIPGNWEGGATCLAGGSYPHRVYVAVSNFDETKVCRTALVHELAHVWYHKLDTPEAGDADHENSQLWAVVKAVDTQVCAWGW